MKKNRRERWLTVSGLAILIPLAGVYLASRNNLINLSEGTQLALLALPFGWAGVTIYLARRGGTEDRPNSPED